MDSIQVDQVVDLKGLSCPMPMLKTKKTLQKTKPGTVLQIVITDSGSKNDLPGMLEKNGDELMDLIEDNGVFTFFVKKG